MITALHVAAEMPLLQWTLDAGVDICRMEPVVVDICIHNVMLAFSGFVQQAQETFNINEHKLQEYKLQLTL